MQISARPNTRLRNRRERSAGRRVRRCFEAALLRLGIQGQAPQSGRSLLPTEAYADAFDNPPLLIVSDMQEIRVHTNFTNTIAQQHVIPLMDLRSVEARDLLRNCFIAPDKCCQRRRAKASQPRRRPIASIAVALGRHHDERRVAHFINKLVFCLFAEDIELLPNRVFADILDEAVKRPDDFKPMLSELFLAMANRNGRSVPPRSHGSTADFSTTMTCCRSASSRCGI